MYYSKLAAPILLVADCTQAPPLDLAEEVLGSEIRARRMRLFGAD